MTWVLAYNRSHTVQQIDTAGRRVDAEEFTYADDTDTVYLAGVAARFFLTVPIVFDPSGSPIGIDPEAFEAAGEVVLRNGGSWTPPSPPVRPYTFDELEVMIRTGRLSQAALIQLITDNAPSGGGGGGVGTVVSVNGVEPDVDGNIELDIRGVGESHQVITASGATRTLADPAVAENTVVTLDQDCLFTLPVELPTDKTFTISVLVKQPSSGGSYDFAASWAPGVGGVLTWFDMGTQPIIATGQGAVTGISFTTSNGGATWIGTPTVVDPGNQGVTLVIDGSGHVATDASVGDIFDVVLTRNVIMDAPSGLTRNKRILYRFLQSGAGNFTVGWATIFHGSPTSPMPVVVSTAAGTFTYAAFINNTLSSKLDHLGANPGF